MNNFALSLCATLAIMTCSVLARAEQGILAVLVMDTQDRPFKGVTLSVGGDGGKDTTGNDGRARIPLAAGTLANSTVYIYLTEMPLDPVKKRPLDLVLISPWDGYILVPPFDDENKNFIKIVMAERGDRMLLVYGDAAKAMVSQINAKAGGASSGNAQLTPEERKQVVLAEVAKDFGLKPAEVDQAIRKWGATAKDKHDVGLAKFYTENYEEARLAFSEAKAQRKKEAEQALDRVAESAYFEAKAWFRQTKYQDAIASYKEALDYRPNDTDILSDLAWTYEIVNEFDTAEPLYKQAIEISEKTFGQSHEEVASNVGALGSFYVNRRDFKQGALLFERMVAIREKAKGPEHSDVAHDLNNLAVVYMALGKIPEAEKSLERALRVIEKNSGVESPDLAFTLNTIASLHVANNNTLEAERVLNRSLDVLRKTFDKSQDKAKEKRRWADNYAQAASSLGYMYLRQGRIARAEQLLKEALDYQEIRGPLQPYDIKHLNQLADLYEGMGNFNAAEKLHVRALEIVENAVGKDHPATTTKLIDLALVREAQKRFQDAESLRMRVLKIVEKSKPASLSSVLLDLGKFYERQKKLVEAEDYHKRSLAQAEATSKKPTDAITLVNALANYYERQSKFAEAEAYRKRILSILEQADTGDSTQVAAALDVTAQFYERQKKYSEAEDYYKRAEDAIEKSPEKNTVVLISLLNNRADLYENQKRVDEAEQLYKRAAEIISKTEEPEYPNKVATLNALANFYWRQKRYAEAEQFYGQAQTIIDNAKDVKATDKLALLLNRGRLLEDEKKYAEAEAIYKQFRLVLKKENGSSHPNIAKLQLKLAGIARQQGKDSDAEESLKQALSIFEQELGQEDPNVATTLEVYAKLLRDTKRDSEASVMESRAKKIRDRLTQVHEGEN